MMMYRSQTHCLPGLHNPRRLSSVCKGILVALMRQKAVDIRGRPQAGKMAPHQSSAFVSEGDLQQQAFNGF